MTKSQDFKGGKFKLLITRQIYPHATPQNCSDCIKNLFRLYIYQEDTWYSMTPGIVHHDQPAIFGPQGTNPIALHCFAESQHSGMYTRNELRVI